MGMIVMGSSHFSARRVMLVMMVKWTDANSRCFVLETVFSVMIMNTGVSVCTKARSYSKEVHKRMHVTTYVVMTVWKKLRYWMMLAIVLQSASARKDTISVIKAPVSLVMMAMNA